MCDFDFLPSRVRIGRLDRTKNQRERERERLSAGFFSLAFLSPSLYLSPEKEKREREREREIARFFSFSREGWREIFGTHFFKNEKKKKERRERRAKKQMKRAFCLLSALTSPCAPFFYLYVRVYLFCVFKTRVRARSFFVLCCALLFALLRNTKALCFRVC